MWRAIGWRRIPGLSRAASQSSAGSVKVSSRSLAEPSDGVELIACHDSGEWDAAVAQYSGATVFHQMIWLRLIASHSHSQLTTYLIVKAGVPVGAFPVFVYRRGPFRIAASPPPQSPAPYLGPLVSRELLPESVAALTEHMRRRGISYVEIRFPHRVEGAWLVENGFVVEERSTFLLDLRPGPDQLWTSSLTSPCRRAVRKATASGVTVQEGDLLIHLDRYYEMASQVFAKSRRQPPLSREDYASLGTIARSGGPVRVFLAFREGRVIAGGIFPFDGKVIYYLDGASEQAELSRRPNNLLHWEVIRWACEHGLVMYDMVGAGIASIARFKRGFGPVESPHTYAFQGRTLLTRAARTMYGFLAPAGRVVKHAARQLSKCRGRRMSRYGVGDRA